MRRYHGTALEPGSLIGLAMLALAGCAAPAAGTGGMVETGDLPPLDAGAATAPPEQLAYDILQAIDMRARLETAAQMYGLAPELGASIYFRWLDGTMHELRGLDRQQIDQLLRHAEANLTFYQEAAKARGQFPIAGAWRATVQHGCSELWGDGASITFKQTGAFVQTSTTKFDFGAVVGNTLVLLDVAPHYDRPVASLQGDYNGNEIAFNTPDCVATLRRA